MDFIDQLECVYYPGPVPANNASLTALCFIFDKIYVPKVYLPKGGYDKEWLSAEIERLIALKRKDYGTSKLVGMLKFLDCRIPFDGILEYPHKHEDISSHRDKSLEDLVFKLYDLNFPPRKNFHPHFDTVTSKGLDGGDESITFAGDFYYQANAIVFAAERQLPLIDDGSWLPLPFKAKYKNNAPALAALLALESLELVLPELPILPPQELVDFRIENKKELRTFRSGMLRYTQSINSEISADTPPEEIADKIKYFVKSELAPALHDLSRDLRNPNRPWLKRLGDGVSVVASVMTGVLTGGLVGQTAAEGLKNVLVSELEGAGSKRDATTQNGLYYLLKARGIARRP